MDMLQGPIVIVNLKTYGESTGELAEGVARAAVAVLEERRKRGLAKVVIALAVPATEIYRLSSLGLVPVFAEHLDPESPGAHTGRIIAEDIKHNGAVGTLLNHSEDQYAADVLSKASRRAEGLGLVRVVCAPNAQAAADIARLRPELIAMEPPELIGGPVSVSAARPSLITETVEKVKAVGDIPVLVGAGVQSAEDVRVALKLGAKGVLLASGVAKAKDVTGVLQDLLSGFD